MREIGIATAGTSLCCPLHCNCEVKGPPGGIVMIVLPISPGLQAFIYQRAPGSEGSIQGANANKIQSRLNQTKTSPVVTAQLGSLCLS